MPVAGADVRAADQDLADLVGAGGAAVLAEDLEVHAFGRTAHRHDAAGRAEGAELDQVACDPVGFGHRQPVIEHAIVANVRPDRRDVAVEQRLRSHADGPDVLEPPPRPQTLEELAHDGRDGVKHGDALTVEPVRESRDAFAPHVVAAQGRAGDQAAEDVRDGRAEAQREEQREPVAGLGANRASVQPAEIQHVAMRLQHALGLAGRPGRVEARRHGVRRDDRQRYALVARRQVRDVEDRTAGGGELSRTPEKRGLGQERNGLAVLQDESQPIVRVTRVERNVRAARACDAVDRGKGERAAFEQQARESGAPVGRSRHAPCDRIRHRVELGVGERAIPFDDRRPVRIARRDVSK